MTKEEVLLKFGDVKLMFTSYWKYSFIFSGIADSGELIECSVGGNSDDIYRFGVSNNSEYTLKELFPYSINVYKNNENIFFWYE